MAFFWSSFIKDFRRSLRDPWRLGLWIAVPLLLGTAITLATGGESGVAPQAKLLIVDHDQTLVSSLFGGVFSEGPLSNLIQSEKVAEEAGRRRIQRGDASGLLIIPKGFSDAVLEGTPAELVLIENPSEQILPQILRQTVEVLGEGIFYIREIFGDDISKIAALTEGERSPDPETLAGLNLSISTAFGSLTPFLNPPLITIETSVTSEQPGDSVNFGLLFFPGIIFMAIFLVAQHPAEDLWDEKAFGTLRRVRTSPGGVTRLLAGKLAAGVLLILIISGIGLAIGMAYYGITSLDWPGAVLWCGLAGLDLVLLLLAVQLIAPSRRAGAIMGAALLFPLLMLGGSFFPSEVMPRWMGAAGRWTPNGIGVEVLKDILLGRLEMNTLLASAGVLLVLGVLLALVVFRGVSRETEH